MTKKRFTNIGIDIFQHGEWYCAAKGEHCADVIATALNEVLEENSQLKQQNEALSDLNNHELQTYQEKVLAYIDEKIRQETYSAEAIEKTIEGDYNVAVNRLTIAVLEELRKELSE